MSQPTRFAGTTGHPVGEEKSGLAAGIDKGVALTKRPLPSKHSYRKGVSAPTPATTRALARPAAEELRDSPSACTPPSSL